MQLLLDKLAATIIVLIIALTVAEINLDGREVLTETTAFYAISAQTEAFAKILRRDLQGLISVTSTTEVVGSDGTTVFQFVGRIGQDTTRHTVSYRKRPVTTRKGISFYEIERDVDGVVSGGSGDFITEWEIKALNEDGSEIVNPDNTAQVYVRFVAASPYVDSDIIKSIQWESRFFPPMRN